MCKTTKKILGSFCLLGVVLSLVACSSCDKDVATHHNKSRHLVEYENISEMDVNKNMLVANMYTKRGGRGEKLPIGQVFFMQSEQDVVMKTDLSDLRPNVEYRIKAYKCTDEKCSTSECVDADFPIIKIEQVGKLEKEFVIPNMSLNEFHNVKIHMVRDGGKKAAWGKINIK